MPYIFNLQMYAEEAAGADVGSIGDAATVADSTPEVSGEQQVAPADGDQAVEESFDSLIKGKYKKDYDLAVKKALDRRFKNQQDLSARIKSIDPLVKGLAERYKIQANPDGSIPIDALTRAALMDDKALEQEAFDRGMPVDTLRQIKSLEQENAQLRGMEEQQRQQAEWNALNEEAEALKEYYPDFSLNDEMGNPEFISLLATLRNSNFPNAVKRAYEVIHHDDIMSGSMQYATQKAKVMASNAIQSGMNRPKESASGTPAAGGMQGLDPSKLTDEQMDDIIRRAARGERITFS